MQMQGGDASAAGDGNSTPTAVPARLLPPDRAATVLRVAPDTVF